MSSRLSRSARQTALTCLLVVASLLSIGGCALNRNPHGKVAARLKPVMEPPQLAEAQQAPSRSADRPALQADDSDSLADPTSNNRFASLVTPAAEQPAEAGKMPALHPEGPAFPRQAGGLREARRGGQAVLADSFDSPLPAAGPRMTIPQMKPAESAPRVAATPRRQAVLHADESTFSQEVLRADVPVLVDFYADWCGPCRALSPTIQELAAEVPNAKVVKVNIDESPELAAQYGIKSIPSLMLFKDGQPSARQTGPASKARLKAMLEQ